jgi:hypothetical protein
VYYLDDSFKQVISKWSEHVDVVPRGPGMATNIFLAGTIFTGLARHPWMTARAWTPALQKVIRGWLDTTCDTASRKGGVMLRLRFCYVSKAAILTVPVHHVLVENRSPA